MKFLVAALLLTAAVAAAAASGPDFSGTWVFNPGKSKNVGMMASMEYTSTVTQTNKTLTVQEVTVFNGQKQTRETHYDFDGGMVTNDTPMGEKADTTTKWSGEKLVTNWETDGAVAGTKVLRTETRYLSKDGKTMFLESARAGKEPMVIVFDRK